MVNLKKLKIRLFEGITPKYYHGKEFKWLESDLEKGFLKGYIDEYTEAHMAIDKTKAPESPPIYLKRDRKIKGEFISGLEEAKVYAKEGAIYVFNEGIINLKGYKDNGYTNVTVTESIDLHKFLEKIVVSSKTDFKFGQIKELVSRLNYPLVKVEKLL